MRFELRRWVDHLGIVRDSTLTNPAISSFFGALQGTLPATHWRATMWHLYKASGHSKSTSDSK